MTWLAVIAVGMLAAGIVLHWKFNPNGVEPGTPEKYDGFRI